MDMKWTSYIDPVATGFLVLWQQLNWAMAGFHFSL